MKRTTHIQRLVTFMTALLLSSSVLADTNPQYEQALAAWARVLSAHVDAEGRTDFIGLSADTSDLDLYVATIAELGPQQNPQLFNSADKVMAYHINTYNALAMKGVIERGIPEGFTSFFKRASFFKFRTVRLDGRDTNLHAYENKVIRPLDEPRSHFALNCMVKDCPRLPQQPFTANNLDAELEAATLEFFSKPRHLVIDHDSKRIYVSAILDFYTKDFVKSGRRDDLPEYINRYLPEPLPADYAVRYLDYDWRINQSPRS